MTVTPEMKYFEYHCLESDASSDADLWYRSHSRVQVTGITEQGVGDTPEERAEEGCPRVYRIRFEDGFEHDAFEDELLDSEDQYERPDPPPVAERYYFNKEENEKS